MNVLASFPRVRRKNRDFYNIFGYFLVAPIFPKAVVLGPQEESDIFEAKLDKCIQDKVDYFAEEYGYDSEEERKSVEARDGIFED